MEWQLIETAPKDGRPLLLFYPEGIWDAEFNDFEGRSVWDMAVMRADERGYWEGYYSATTPNGEPTHWMPCPSPPA